MPKNPKVGYQPRRFSITQTKRRGNRDSGLADKIYESCLQVLRDFRKYLERELDSHGLENEHVAAIEQSVDDLYLWGTSFPHESLESTLERLDYLID